MVVSSFQSDQRSPDRPKAASAEAIAISPSPSPPDAAYVHIPFCRRRCFYCDFPVSVVGDTRRGENSGAIAQYIEHLCQEIRHTPSQGTPLQTVFFGGGTPSLLAVDQLATLLETLDQHFGIASQAEISMEMDPGTFDLPHVQGYRAAGINRVSLGVQAFQADLLQLCGRTHQPADIPIAIAQVRQAGITNVGLDLISGLPQQTLGHWEESLARAIALQPTHLSVYDLIVEPGTAFARQYQPGAAPLPSESQAAQMYRLGQQRLTAAGYKHYEISNYAQPGSDCRHNRVYWQNRSYYGFGMGAASYVSGQRFTRPRTRREYVTWLDAGMPIHEPPTSPLDALLDTLMLGLRLSEGVSLVALTAQFGDRAVNQVLRAIAPFLSQDLVRLSETPDPYLFFHDPEGFLLSNTILATIFEALERDF